MIICQGGRRVKKRSSKSDILAKAGKSGQYIVIT